MNDDFGPAQNAEMPKRSHLKVNLGPFTNRLTGPRAFNYTLLGSVSWVCVSHPLLPYMFVEGQLYGDFARLSAYWELPAWISAADFWMARDPSPEPRWMLLVQSLLPWQGLTLRRFLICPLYK